MLSETPHADWEGTLIPITIAGCMLHETVFVHPSSGSVIAADLTENFASSDHAFTRLYLKLAGLEHQIGWSRLLRMVYRNHQLARASVNRVLDHEFERVVISHGSVIERGGRAAIDQTFSFLRG